MTSLVVLKELVDFLLIPFFMERRSSFSPLAKLALLSDLISGGLPLLAMNLRIALMNESVSRLDATSI